MKKPRPMEFGETLGSHVRVEVDKSVLGNFVKVSVGRKKLMAGKPVLVNEEKTYLTGAEQCRNFARWLHKAAQYLEQEAEAHVEVAKG